MKTNQERPSLDVLCNAVLQCGNLPPKPMLPSVLSYQSQPDYSCTVIPGATVSLNQRS